MIWDRVMGQGDAEVILICLRIRLEGRFKVIWDRAMGQGDAGMILVRARMRLAGRCRGVLG